MRSNGAGLAFIVRNKKPPIRRGLAALAQKPFMGGRGLCVSVRGRRTGGMVRSLSFLTFPHGPGGA